MKKKLTKYQLRMLKMLLGSGIYFLIMLFASTSAGALLNDGELPSGPFLFITFVLVIGLLVYKIVLGKRRVMDFIRHGIGIAFYLALAVLSLFVRSSLVAISLIGVIYALSLISDRTFSIIKKKTKRHIVMGVIVYFYSFLLIIISLALFGLGEDSAPTVLAITPITIVVTSFISVMRLIFSGLRGKTLVQIIRKTYTIEILYGLLTLMFATSIMLTLIEPNMEHFGDALWYCFAVVTTTGFGDIVAVTFLGRVLTVILGIYGIIVVALITSIIVNFYNETSSEKEEKVIKQELKELEELRSKEEHKED